MRFDINIDFVMSVEVFDEADATDLAERIASRVELEAEYAAGAALIAPPSLAVVTEITPVDS